MPVTSFRQHDEIIRELSLEHSFREVELNSSKLELKRQGCCYPLDLKPAGLYENIFQCIYSAFKVLCET